MSLSYNGINLGTGADTGDGSSIRAGGQLINTAFTDVYASLNAVISAIGLATDTSVELGVFTGTTISDGRTVKQALQEIETYVESLNVLDAGYVAGSAVAPSPLDSIEVAISKLHGLLNALDQAIILKGDWDASAGTFPASTNAGWSYIVSVAGTVGGVQFNIGDRLISILDNASTSVYAGNWFKADGSDLVTSFNSRTGAIVPTANDYSAAQVSNAPAGNVAAVTVQAAIDELDGDKVDKATLSSKGSILTRNITAPVELGVGTNGQIVFANSATSTGLEYRTPAGTDVTNTPAGDVAATTVQAAINELDGDKTAKATLTTKGDIYAASAASTPARVAVGVDGLALMADSTASTGVAYGVQLESRFDQVNLTANTTLAASVVNTSNYIAFAQTTAGITATIPSPTVSATKHRTVTLCNEGTSTLGVVFSVGSGFFLNPGNVMDITWNGTQWVAANAQLALLGEYGHAIIANLSSIPAANSAIALTSATGNIAISGNAIPVTVGSTYRFEASIARANFSSSVGEVTYQFRDVTNGVDIGNPGSLSCNYSVATGWGGSATGTYTPTANGSVQLVVKKNVSGNIFDGNSGTNAGSVSVTKTAGFAPILGTTVDFINARLTANTTVANGAAIPLTTLQGNIQNASGVFTLKAGKTYRLTGGAAYAGGGTISAGSNAGIQWRDITNNALIGNVAQPMSPAAADTATPLPIAEAIVQVGATDITVRLEAIGTGNPFSAGLGTGGSTFGTIQQIGSTAFAGAIDYSTSEMDTGRKWVNGKPIYRKTVAFTNVAAGSTFIDATLSITTVQDLVSLGGVFKEASFHLPLPYTDVSSVANSVSVILTGSGVQLGRGANRAASNSGYVTLEYTKV